MLISQKRLSESSWEEAALFSRQVMQRVNSGLNLLTERVNNLSTAINHNHSSEPVAVLEALSSIETSSSIKKGSSAHRMGSDSAEFKKLFAKKESLQFFETQVEGYFVWDVTETYPKFYYTFNKIVNTRSKGAAFLQCVNESLNFFKKCMVRTATLQDFSVQSLLAKDLHLHHGIDKIPLYAELNASQIVKNSSGDLYAVSDPLLTALVKAFILSEAHAVCSELDVIIKAYIGRPLSLSIKLDGNEYAYHYLNIYTLICLLGNRIEQSLFFSTLTERELASAAFLVLPDGRRVGKAFPLKSTSSINQNILELPSLASISTPKAGRLVTRDGWLKLQKKLPDEIAANLTNLKTVFFEYLLRPNEDLRQLLQKNSETLSKLIKPLNPLKRLTDYLTVLKAFATQASIFQDGKDLAFYLNEYPSVQPYFNFALSSHSNYFSQNAFKELLIFIHLPINSKPYNVQRTDDLIFNYHFSWQATDGNTKVDGIMSLSKALEPGSFRTLFANGRGASQPISQPVMTKPLEFPIAADAGFDPLPVDGFLSQLSLPEFALEEVPQGTNVVHNEIPPFKDSDDFFSHLSPLCAIPEYDLPAITTESSQQDKALQTPFECLQLLVTTEEFIESELKSVTEVIQLNELTLFLNENTSVLKLIHNYMNCEELGILVRKKFTKSPPQEIRLLIQQPESIQYTLNIESKFDLTSFFEPKTRANYVLKSCDSNDRELRISLELSNE